MFCAEGPQLPVSTNISRKESADNLRLGLDTMVGLWKRLFNLTRHNGHLPGRARIHCLEELLLAPWFLVKE